MANRTQEQSDAIHKIEKEIALKELEIKKNELDGRGITQNKVVILSATISLVSATVVALITSYFTRDSEISQAEIQRISAEIVQKLKGESDQSIAEIQAKNSLDLEREKLQRDLVSNAISAGSQEETRNRLSFLAAVGLLPTYDSKIKEYIENTDIEDLPGTSEIVSGPMQFDPDYDGREGYDRDFLSITVPLPSVNYHAVGDDVTFPVQTLPYRHFSILKSEGIFPALVAAANVDYLLPTGQNIPRRRFGSERVVFDPRISDEYQLGNEVYKRAKKVDRGHIISRRYIYWGESLTDIVLSNSDAFHWTNITLQNENFNRSNRKGVWGEIENRVGELTGRFSVFAGPIIEDNGVFLSDHITDGERIRFPIRFWKLIVKEHSDHLSAIAFIFHQPMDNMSDELSFDEPWSNELAENLEAGVWVISLKSLEKEIKYLNFPEILHAFDAVSRGDWNKHELAFGIDKYRQQ